MKKSLYLILPIIFLGCSTFKTTPIGKIKYSVNSNFCNIHMETAWTEKYQRTSVKKRSQILYGMCKRLLTKKCKEDGKQLKRIKEPNFLGGNAIQSAMGVVGEKNQPRGIQVGYECS